MFLWVVGWAIISYVNRDSTIISKRGVANMILFSIAAFGSFAENITILDIFQEQFNYTIPCVFHLYLNYVFFGLFMFGYQVRAAALLFEKHMNMIKLYADQPGNLDSYLKSIWLIERQILRIPSLLRKFEKRADRGEVVEEHFNQAKFSKPAFLFKATLVFIVVGCIGASCALATQPQKTHEAHCIFAMYLPVYIYAGLLIILGFSIFFLLRRVSDPYFFKKEFVIVMGFVVPLCFVLALGLKAIAFANWPIFIVIAVVVGHFVSVVYPNMLVLKMRKAKFESLQSSRKNSFLQNNESNVADLRKRAAENFCLELVNFKEDYDKMKAIKDLDTTEQLGLQIYNKYFAKNAPQEISLTFSTAHQIRLGFTGNEKNISVLDRAYSEIMSALLRNLGEVII